MVPKPEEIALPDRLRTKNAQLREALRRTVAESRRLHAEAREVKDVARMACERANHLRNEREAQRAADIKPRAKIASRPR